MSNYLGSNDPVNHPAHYTDGKYETIDFIERYNFHDSFCLGNAIKYISRAGKKDPDKKKEDLKKAIWYLERFVCESQTHDQSDIDVFDYVKDKQLSEAIIRLTMLKDDLFYKNIKKDPEIQKVINNVKEEIQYG